MSSSENFLPPRRASDSVLMRGGPLARELARLAVVLDHADELAGLGDAVEAEDLDRLAGAGLLDLVALVVVHRADAAPVGAGHDVVADLERAALDEDRHDRRRGPGRAWTRRRRRRPPCPGWP
jgi:hypothetical protein